MNSMIMVLFEICPRNFSVLIINGCVPLNNFCLSYATFYLVMSSIFNWYFYGTVTFTETVPLMIIRLLCSTYKKQERTNSVPYALFRPVFCGKFSSTALRCTTPPTPWNESSDCNCNSTPPKLTRLRHMNC